MNSHPTVSSVTVTLCLVESRRRAGKLLLAYERAHGKEANLARLRAVFEAWLADEYPAVRLRDVRMIVAAHFFSIVPLHDNRGHQVQFLAKARALLADDAKLAVL